MFNCYAHNWQNIVNPCPLCHPAHTLTSDSTNFQLANPPTKNQCNHAQTQTLDVNPPFTSCLDCGAVLSSPTPSQDERDAALSARDWRHDISPPLNPHDDYVADKGYRAGYSAGLAQGKRKGAAAVEAMREFCDLATEERIASAVKTTKEQRGLWLKQQPNMAFFQEKLCSDIDTLESRVAWLEGMCERAKEEMHPSLERHVKWLSDYASGMEGK